MLKISSLVGFWEVALKAVPSMCYLFGGTPNNINPGTGITPVEKYLLTNDSRTLGSSINIATTDGGSDWCGCGDLVHAVVMGSGSGTCYKYAYVGEGTSSGGSLTNLTAQMAPAQSPTTGYSFGGAESGTVVAKTYKYLFSTDGISAGTALGTARFAPGATSTATQAIIGGGSTGLTAATAVATTNKYTFSGDTQAAATALGTARRRVSATGNTTVGIFAGGENTSSTQLSTTEKYTYSGDTRVAGTALATPRWAPGLSCGDNNIGLFAGGQTTGGTPVSSTDKYTFSGDSRTAGTALNATDAAQAGACTTPGGQ